MATATLTSPAGQPPASDAIPMRRIFAFIAMGAVVLTITGAEALYADMGHFGRRAIKVAWYGVVLPGLTLNTLLKLGLIIPAALLYYLFPLHIQQNTVNERGSGRNAAIKIHRGKYRLGGVRQNGGALASAAGLLALSQPQIAA